jgi:hypothetical protein
MDGRNTKPLPAARAYVGEFVEDFFLTTEGDRYDFSFAYIYKVGVSLQSAKRHYGRTEKLSARQWAVRYNRSRREAKGKT